MPRGADLKSGPGADGRGHSGVVIVTLGGVEGNSLAPLDQASVQAVPVWVRPMVISRRRFSPATR